MKRVNELITPENSFFTVFQTEHHNLYMELFETFGEQILEAVPPESLDMQIMVKCGERYAAPLLIHHSMSEAVDFIVKRYGDGWRRIKMALVADYDVTKPYNVQSVTTGEKNASNDTTSNSTDKTGVVGFDSEIATDNTVDTNENTVNIAQNESTNTTVIHSGTNGNVSIPSLIASEIEVRKNSFISIVVNDIQSQITLDIY